MILWSGESRADSFPPDLPGQDFWHFQPPQNLIPSQSQFLQILRVRWWSHPGKTLFRLAGMCSTCQYNSDLFHWPPLVSHNSLTFFISESGRGKIEITWVMKPTVTLTNIRIKLPLTQSKIWFTSTSDDYGVLILNVSIRSVPKLSWLNFNGI